MGERVEVADVVALDSKRVPFSAQVVRIPSISWKVLLNILSRRAFEVRPLPSCLNSLKRFSIGKSPNSSGPC